MASTAQRYGKKKFAPSLFRQTKRDTHSGAVQRIAGSLPRLSLLHCKGPPSATPTSIGSSAVVWQRQLPLSVF
jgi:hypothetical protein